MGCARIGTGVGLLGLAAGLLLAAPPWKNDNAASWTPRELETMLTASPWAQSAEASFALAEEEREPDRGPLPGASSAGLAGPRGASDGRWDGGVGRPDRNGPPSLSVTVRWDSALPIRLALQQRHDRLPFTPEQLQRDYVITVVGLVPARQILRSGSAAESSSDDPLNTSHQAETLEGVMRYSRLLPKGQPAIRPDDAKLDSATGTMHLFFPRTAPVTANDKEVFFVVRFGSLSVTHRFRLKDMVYKGQLEL